MLELHERTGCLPERLHKRGEYLQVQNRGRKFRGQGLMLMVGHGNTTVAYGQPEESIGSARMGYTVSRKVGNAVVRNRIRRILKEAVRVNAHMLCQGLDHVVVAHPTAAATPHPKLRQELTCLLERAQTWAQAMPSATGPLPCTA